MDLKETIIELASIAAPRAAKRPLPKGLKSFLSLLWTRLDLIILET